MVVQFIPETPRYLFVHGKQKEAQALLIKMAKFNRKDITVGKSKIFSTQFVLFPFRIDMYLYAWIQSSKVLLSLHE